MYESLNSNQRKRKERDVSSAFVANWSHDLLKTSKFNDVQLSQKT